MKDEELELLRSYENGPRIWDATSVQPKVWALAERGLIEAVDQEGYRYRLTSKGRETLRDAARADQHDYEPDHEIAWNPCKVCGHDRNHAWHI